MVCDPSNGASERLDEAGHNASLGGDGLCAVEEFASRITHALTVFVHVRVYVCSLDRGETKVTELKT